MAYCDQCGEEIVFRYLDGRPTPIHTSGNRCSGQFSGNSSPRPTKPFSTIQSYVNPNAHCPVCGDRVFFYQSSYGGRVFFDNLGWPWPKHECTDSERAQTKAVKLIALGYQSTFRSNNGKMLDLYELAGLEEAGDEISLRFRKMGQNIVFSSSVSRSVLQAAGVSIDDIKQAPSFVVATYSDSRTVEFISGRERRIITLNLSRAKG